MNQSALKTFIAIIETGSLVKASERLNVTQSSVTMRLKALEEEVGQTLIIRQKSGVSLTAAGTKLLSYARVIDGLWGQALRATSLPQGMSQIYNIGCTPLLWDLGGRHFFNKLRAYEAGFALSVQQADEGVLIKGLNEGTIDMALVGEPVVRKSQKALQLDDEELALYSDRIETPLRFDSQYVYVDYGPDFRRQHDEYYYDAGAAYVSFNTAQMALSYLREFGGSAYLPRRLVKEARAQDEGDDAKKRLFEMEQAPCFQLQKHLIMKLDERDNSAWIEALLSESDLLSR